MFFISGIIQLYKLQLLCSLKGFTALNVRYSVNLNKDRTRAVSPGEKNNRSSFLRR